MAKPTRGLPSSFSLGAKREDLDAPVDIGDFLDEDLAPAPRPKAPAVEPEPEQAAVGEGTEEAVPPASAERIVEVVPARPAPVEPVALQEDPQPRQQFRAFEPEHEPPPQASPPQRRSAPAARDRIQINLSPEGRAAHDAVMEHFRRFCPREPNTKHNEVYQSLMIALSEALRHYDLSMVPRRGGWGSATHRSFVASLKGAAVKALGKHYFEEHPPS